MLRTKQGLFILLFLLTSLFSFAQKEAAKPMYDDPLYHGAADPVVVYNKPQKLWYMLYTNRRATLNDSSGVRWVHGTPIGIASSKDGKNWKYVDTANIDYRPDSGYTFWAPDVVEQKGIYHMYLTYVPGIFADWQHPREIVHCTSKDLRNWKFESKLQLAAPKVIDASVFKVNDTLWRMWYNNERDHKSIYYADSKDLYHWTDKGQAMNNRGEGPKVFRWQNQYFMIVDIWKGMEVYSSQDLLHWTKQPDRILEAPGTAKDDQAIGGHCDIVVNNNRAYIFYFTHPGRRKDAPAPRNSFDDKTSVIQISELKYQNGQITCDRNEITQIELKAPASK